jgi:hypothetical protein
MKNIKIDAMKNKIIQFKDVNDLKRTVRRRTLFSLPMCSILQGSGIVLVDKEVEEL